MSKRSGKIRYDPNWRKKVVDETNKVVQGLRIGPDVNNSDMIITQDSSPESWAELFDQWQSEGEPGALIYKDKIYSTLTIDECTVFLERI
jgi:hypothetical protein